MQFVILSIILLITFLFLRWLKRLTATSTALPPGPNGYPIIGNLLDMPSVTPWKTFTDWSKVYGDVVYLNLASQPTVILNSAKSAFDLLEKRSDIYSDRPTSTVVEMIFWDWNIGLMPYSPKWRNHRREFHQYFNQREVPKFQPIQLRESRAFLRRALNSNNDNDLGQHVRHIFTAIILKIAYDMDITDIHDEYVRLAEEAVLGLSVVMLPGAHWVEYFPFLKHLPEWFPGFLVKRTTNYYRPIVETMRNKPFDKIQQDIHDGKATPSLTTSLIERMQRRSGSSVLSPTDEELARNVSGISYAAAADTTTSAAQSFMIAMSLYPDIQRKAQEELHRVVGPDRLPDFDDHDDLVYIQAIALEAMRWMVVLPLGVYHRVMSDDIYNGFLIPKGSTVIANAWAMLHDPVDYPEPTVFKPERYIKDGKLDPSVRNPLTLAFGFGRRICPGRYLATGSLFMTIASVLHTFTIQPTVNEDGKVFDPFSSVVSGIVSSPDYVPCIMTPRSDKARQLIQESSI